MTTRRTGLLLAGSLAAGVAGAIALGQRSFDRLVQRDIDTLLARRAPARAGVVTDEMLHGLPAPVQRHLRFAGVVGKPFAQTVRATQRGVMRLAPEMPAIPLDARVVYTVNPPGFVWDGTLRFGPLPFARARDLYRTGVGKMLVKALALVQVADIEGPEMDRGGMMRYLNETTWFPTALLGDDIAFEAIDDTSARVTFSDHGRSISGTLHIDADGRLVRFAAEQYRASGDGFELTPWQTVTTRYGEMGGYQVPLAGKAVWTLPEGEFTYIELEVTALDDSE